VLTDGVIDEVNGDFVVDHLENLGPGIV